MNLDDYDVIILDCDGVVFNSNLLKAEAFKKALKSYDNEIVNKFIIYFKNNFGSSRYHFVKYFIEKLLNIPFNEKINNDILNAYGQNCIQLYKKSELTEYFLEFLMKYRDKRLYIASGGDELELNSIFKEKQINQYFREILGSPKKKTDLVKHILVDNKDKNTIMIGDAKSDLMASMENEIDFIFMSQYSLVKSEMLQLVKKHNYKNIANLKDLVE